MCAWEEYISAYYRTLRWRFFCTLCWRGNIWAYVCGQKLMLGVFLSSSPYFSASLKTVFQAILKFTVQLKLTTDFWQFCLYLLSAESPSVCTCMCVHAWSVGWNETQGFMHIRQSASLSPSILSFEEASSLHVDLNSWWGSVGRNPCSHFPSNGIMGACHCTWT